jgi:hypothetical protein
VAGRWRKEEIPVKCGVRVALGVAGGYFLGRTKKMKLAMMLGGMAAGRQAGGAGQLLRQGAKLLGESPELGRLTDEIRNRLLDAAKVAAVAVATRQVEALTERVSRVGTPVGDAGKTVSDVGDTVGKTVSDAGETVGGVGETVGGLERRRSGDEADSDEEPSEYYDHEDEDEYEYEEEPSEEPEDLDESPDDSARARTEADKDVEEEEPAAPPRPTVRAGTGGRARKDQRGPQPVRGRRDG